MHHFHDGPDTFVDDVLEGLARRAPVRLSDPASGVRVVVRDHVDGGRVAVLSGGGSGHEPSHGGLVGEGMLTAAVAGDVFASPGVDAVLAGLREVTGEAGCLVVMKAYTGDRLNFGLAAERAASEGLDVRTVLVADDVALPDADPPRGLAGTALVHKVAGHLAESGRPLDEVTATAQEVSDALVTLSMALSSATLPGDEPDRRGAELGLGIHNEPGAREVDPADAAEAVALVLDPLLEAADARHGEGTGYVVLLNEAGGLSTQEGDVLCAEVLRRLGDRAVRLVGPAPVMTSLDMRGFSVTLLPAREEWVDALDAPTAAPGWPGCVTPREVRTFAPRLDDHGDEHADGPRDEARAARVRAVCRALVDARDDLDGLDRQVGDGDAGSTLATGARAVLEALDADRLATGDDAALADGLGRVVGRSAGGSSGVLLAILLAGAATALRDGQGWPAAVRAGTDRVGEHGGARPGDRTFLDALVPALDALDDGGDLDAGARAAREGADATASTTSTTAGRSSYVDEARLDGVVDPGAEAVARALRGLAEA